MTRLSLWLALTLVACALARHHGDRYDEHDEVHHHHNYYGDVHNHHGAPEHHDDQDDDHHDDDHHDDDDHDDDDHHDDDHHDDHVYRFRVDNDFAGYSYKNDHGEVVGFLPELIMKVCERAHKKCHWLYDVFSNCWASEAGGRPGWGLLEGWYDGCVGVVPTTARRNAFNFTESFSAPVRWQLYFKAEHEGNMDGVKVGFVDGFSIQPKCVHDHFDGAFEAVTFASQHELFEAIEHGKVDAVPNTVTEHFAEEHKLTAFHDSFSCQDEGIAVMAHYGSDVIHWWNEVFDDAVHNGDWAEFCRIESALHGDIRCNHIEEH